MHLRKGFPKAFTLRQARFAKMVIDAAENAWEMLCDSLAYLKCSVHSRMQWGDHLLVYINLDNSKVPNSDIVRKELYVYLLADNLITNPNLGSAL